MKITAIFFSAVLVMLVFAPVSYGQKAESGAQNITTTINTARYILFGGTYVVNGEKPGENRESGVFKLDTYTGKVWMLKVEKNGNVRNLQWILIEDIENIVADKEVKKEDNNKRPGMKLKTLDEQ